MFLLIHGFNILARLTAVPYGEAHVFQGTSDRGNRPCYPPSPS